MIYLYAGIFFTCVGGAIWLYRAGGSNEKRKISKGIIKGATNAKEIRDNLSALSDDELNKLL